MFIDAINRWLQSDDETTVISAVWIQQVQPGTLATAPNGDRVTLSGGSAPARYDRNNNIVLTIGGKDYTVRG